VGADGGVRPQIRGVVAFDVDGVLLRPLFLYRMARLRGPCTWVRSLWVGFLFKLGLVTLKEAVERAYRLQRGVPVGELTGIADRLPLVEGAVEVCGELKRAGYLLALVSAGVPQEVVEVVAGKVGADAGRGVVLERDGGVLTGNLLGSRHTAAGKREGLGRIIRAWGFGWGETTVVVDDRGNESLVDAAWRSIGVNPEYPILRKATFVLHTSDLREILEFFPEGSRIGITPQWLAVRHEAFRKAIHACAVAVPAIAHWSRPAALWLVGTVTVLFAFSEALRLIGIALPVFSAVTWRAMRSAESREIVLGPILFGVGIWLSVVLFSPAAATAGVLVLALGDGAASLVGKGFGKRRLSHNPLKTFEGSMALFVVATVVAAFFVSLPWALVTGAVACLVESFAVGALDNLLLPLASSGMVALAARLSYTGDLLS